jgi:hypothetical protein
MHAYPTAIIHYPLMFKFLLRIRDALNLISDRSSTFLMQDFIVFIKFILYSALQSAMAVFFIIFPIHHLQIIVHSAYSRKVVSSHLT